MLARFGARYLRLQLLLAAEQAVGRHPHVFEQHLGRVRGANAHLLFLLALLEPRRPGRNHKGSLAARSEPWLDHRHDHVHIVDHPIAVLLYGLGLHRGHIRAGFGLGDTESSQRRFLDSPVTGGNPGRDLVGRALGENGRHRQLAALDGERDAGAAPGQLLGDQRGHDAGGVGEALLQEVDRVQPHLGRLFDHRPGELLGLVVMLRDRPDLTLGEVVDPVLDLALLIGQLKGNHLQERSSRREFRYWYVPF